MEGKSKTMASAIFKKQDRLTSLCVNNEAENREPQLYKKRGDIDKWRSSGS